MQTTGSFQVRRDRGTVWAFFADAKELVDCLDDPHTVEVVDEAHFFGTLKTGVSFIRGTFNVNGEYIERRPPDRLAASLHGTGLGSGVDFLLAIDLKETATGTNADWNADLTFHGPIAGIGQSLIQRSVDKMANSLFENARRKLEGNPG